MTGNFPLQSSNNGNNNNNNGSNGNNNNSPGNMKKISLFFLIIGIIIYSGVSIVIKTNSRSQVTLKPLISFFFTT